MDGFFNTATGIGSLVALAVGFYLKKNPAFNNKFIPIATFVISLLTQIVNSVGAPGGIGMIDGMPVYEASIFSGAFAGVLAKALLQTWLTTGAHSTTKNLVESIIVAAPMTGKKK
jgi:hypothetical protein